LLGSARFWRFSQVPLDLFVERLAKKIWVIPRASGADGNKDFLPSQIGIFWAFLTMHGLNQVAIEQHRPVKSQG
jgi:hypothetical protein